MWHNQTDHFSRDNLPNQFINKFVIQQTTTIFFTETNKISRVKSLWDASWICGMKEGFHAFHILSWPDLSMHPEFRHLAHRGNHRMSDLCDMCLMKQQVFTPSRRHVKRVIIRRITHAVFVCSVLQWDPFDHAFSKCRWDSGWQLYLCS